ncbi:MAG: [citrate (pro-3S)-lyase] ligase, partial [Acholeplasmataceae bacterium]|nr:[citrate (pro-3S)-lyase] ligase [Acholeplasmataceae bacterium]
VGSEPLDKTTRAYNRMMKKILGSKVIVIDRMVKDGQFISASFARKLAKEQRFDELKEIVPKSTYQFLISEQGRALFK